MIYQLFADCIPIKGVNRSIIYDLTRHSFKFIPNQLYNIVTEQNGCIDITKIKKEHYFKNELIDDYCNFLVKNEFVFQCSKKNISRFKKISIEYNCPHLIREIVLELNKNSDYITEQLFITFEKLGRINLQIKLFDEESCREIDRLLLMCMNKRINSIELIIPFSKKLNILHIKNLVTENQRIISLIIHSTPTELITELRKRIEDNIFHILIYITSEKISDSQHCGFVAPSYFTINIPFFMESKLYNNCLNKKLAIDIYGNIKNCTALNKSYGNLRDVNLVEIVSSSEFQNLWLIKKDEILVCKDCEFRYMCSDCRAYTENGNLYGKPKYCQYNPYEMRWGNE